MQDATAHIPIQLGDTRVCPQYLGRECVEVGKGVDELAILAFTERAAKFSAEGFLYVVVEGEFDKGPLCVT